MRTQPGAAVRDYRFDCLRAMAMLYIVCIEHLDDYTRAFSFDHSFTRVFTISVLGLFVFLSGALLSHRYDVRSPHDVLTFYTRRIARIYPMYLLALGGFALAGITTPTMAVKGLLFLNVITGTSPATLWFVEVILWFYVVTPLLLWRRSAMEVACLTVVFALGLVLASRMSHGLVDSRLALYAPAFGLGALTGRAKRGLAVFETPWAVAVSALVFAFLWWLSLQDLGTLGLLAMRAAAAIIVLPVFLVLARTLLTILPARVIVAASYCSFGVYLLHRLVFLAATRVYQPFAWWDSLLYLFVLCVPIIYACAWSLQWVGDRVHVRPHQR